MARVYIENFEIPKTCYHCDPDFAYAIGCHEWESMAGEFIKKRAETCPLKLKRQPNPFDSVVQLLLDFDLGSEWDGDVRELAQYICDMFKDGAYD